MSTNNVFEIRSLLQNSQSILIAVAQSNDEDVVASGLALYLTLTKMRKQVTIISPSKVKVELSHLYGIDKITDRIAGGNSLVVSMPYKEGSIEKVSYHIDNNRFNLVIEPRDKQLDFDPAQIEYNYGRGDYDTVIVLGAQNVTALGEIYKKHKNIFTQKPIINIDKSDQNTRFGRINIVNTVPVSQSVTQLVKNLRMPLDQDAASNLYTGIMKRTGNLTLDELDPQTLDALSFLGKMKAVNLNKSKSQNNQDRGTIDVTPSEPEDQSKPQENQQKKSQEIVQSAPVQPNGSHNNETPDEWLKPKIFTTNKQGN